MTLTRKHLRIELQKIGLTYRESRAAIKAIFEVLGEKIASGEKIVLPFGSMEMKTIAPKRQYKLGKIVKTYTKPKVHFRRKD